MGLVAGNDLRCPVTPRRKFALVVEGNLIETACMDCKQTRRRQGDHDVAIVLHRYNLLGEHVETEVVRRGAIGEVIPAASR